MHSTFLLIVARLVHILSGIFWVGAVVYNAAFLLPAVRAVGPTGGQVMHQVTQVRRLPTYMMASSILVILSGITMMWWDSRGAQNPWMHSGTGMTFSIGAASAIIAAIFGTVVVSPGVKRVAALAGAMQRGGPPAPEQVAEMQRLQARTTTALNVVAVLLVVAAAAMAIARYVP